MKTWEKWYDEVLPDVPGCPQAVAKNAIRNAAIAFCEQSWVYRVDHDPINGVASDGTYAYVPPAGYKVAMPLTVWYDGNQLLPKTTGDLERLWMNWPTMTGTRPLYFLQEALEVLTVVPMPLASLAGAITLKVALKPSRGATGIDDTIWEKYLEEIAMGAKARLFAIKKKPWSDPARAVKYEQDFSQAIGKAKLAADRNFVRGVHRVRAHYF